MGVINRTPNSFSDHGKSLSEAFFKEQLQSFLNDPTVIIDVGFESTAPMNKAVSLEEEKLRFLDFLEASKDFSFKDRYVSFDTYKISNFRFMTESFKKLHPEARFIFNDVSGVLGPELLNLLAHFKGRDFYYIYTFSHIPSRDQVLDHMNFINEESDILSETIESFIKASRWFHSIGMKDQLLLDPGFGFSKTYEQNWRLIEEFSLLQEKLLEEKITSALVIGLSKKSFLRKFIEKSHPASTEALESLHFKIIREMIEQKKTPQLFRVHDPGIVRRAYEGLHEKPVST